MFIPKELARIAVGALAAAITLSFLGCSGGGHFAPTPVAPAPNTAVQVNGTDRSAARDVVTVVPDLGLQGEVLSATSVTIKESGGFGSTSSFGATFSASGKARGPYPGTFVANGSWSQRSWWHYHVWLRYFHQVFTITSGARRISGIITCCSGRWPRLWRIAFGAAKDLTWQSDRRRGSATTKLITRESLVERLY